MKRSAALVALVTALAASTLPASPGSAQELRRPDFGFANDQMGVRMQTTQPTQEDPHVHVRFVRYAGIGQRQVRLAERQTKPRTTTTYSDAVKLRVGQRVVFTTKGAMLCEPAQRPLHVFVQMRVKLPGRDWWPWFTYTREDHFLMPC